MRVIGIHPRFASLTSHHYNESYGLKREFERRGVEFLLLINRQASPQIVADLQARPVIDDPTFRLEWSFEERTQRFVALLQALVAPELRAGDCVLITVATQLEAHALARWLQALPPSRKPWVAIMFLSDRWNRAGRAEYERQIAEFRTLSATLASLAPEDQRRLIFCTLTDLLAEELGGLLGLPLDVVPMPLPHDDPEPASWPARRPQLPRVALLGGTRREKGSYLIPAIIRACRAYAPVEFLVQLANDTLTPAEIEQLAQIEAEPHVTLIREPMTLPEYQRALQSADLALFPYEIIPYRKRTSGVFAEAVGYGKLVVAPRGTWMAEQIEAGHAAGAIFEALEPDTIAQAIAGCLAKRTTLEPLAQALGAAWRERSSLALFADYLEEQIAIRSRR